MQEIINKLFKEQLEEWGLAAKNYKDLETVRFRYLRLGESELGLQFNPGRIQSSSAKVDSKTLAERPCFLCKKNLPKEQEGLLLSEDFTLLLNPFPILRKHFTIVNNRHVSQRIAPYFKDLLDISAKLGEVYTLFYNGPKCGASAPDHMHFQAGLSEQFPIWSNLDADSLEFLCASEEAQVKAFDEYVCGWLIEGTNKVKITEVFEKIIAEFALLQVDEPEPMMNILTKYDDKWSVVIFPRRKHRPTQYFQEGDAQILLSPASVDFGGLLAVPLKKDFERIDTNLLMDIFEQLALDKKAFEQVNKQIRTL